MIYFKGLLNFHFILEGKLTRVVPPDELMKFSYWN